MNLSRKSLWSAFAAAALLLASCAKEESVSYSTYEQRSLDAWMKLHHPELLENRQEGNGFYYYVDILDAGIKGDTLIAERDCWVKYDFTARDLNGNVGLTRSAKVARQQGTFTRYTYYAPYYRYSGSTYSTLLEGTYYAFRNPLAFGAEYLDAYNAEHPDNPLEEGYQARVGTEMTIYLPSSLAYSSGGASNDAGYGGQYSLDGGVPVIVHARVTARITNPLEAEGEAVDAFAKNNGTLNPIEEDSEEKRAAVRRSMQRGTRLADPYNYTWYNAVDTVPQLYIYHTYFPSLQQDSLLKWTDTYVAGEEPYVDAGSMAQLDREINEALIERFGQGVMTGDTVAQNESANIWYIGRFLDGFIFDTNIDEVKKIIYGEVKSEGTAVSHLVSTSDGNQSGHIGAWYYAIPQLRYGQWATLVTVSTHAYGQAGQAATSSSSSSGGSSDSYWDYYNYLNYYNYINNYYGNSYYGGYYGGYYGDYYGGYYGNYYYPSYDTSDDTEDDSDPTITTEIPSFTPLVFQIYIEPEGK